MLSRILITAFLWVCAPLQAGAQAHCYDDGGSGVDLSGKLLRRIIAGPPNYTSIKSGDRPDTILVLRLGRTICLRADSTGDKLSGIEEVQLLVPEEDRLQMRTYIDRSTVFSGTLRRTEIPSHPFPVRFWARLFAVDLRDPD